MSHSPSSSSSLMEERRSTSLSPRSPSAAEHVDADVKDEQIDSPTPESPSGDTREPTKVEAPASPKHSESPAPQQNGKRKPKAPPAGPQLIGDLPKAETEAKATFTEMPNNHYQYGTLGRSREAGESMLCDCQYEHGVDSSYLACGDGSDCINRLTQVECLQEDCRCRSHCQNQRFQRKQYAPIDIVLTEKKGFGLRAGADLARDAFIYEYVGDVVSQPSMKKRMRDYAKEGIKHFYFMMLQKDEFIDATKRGGIGRFANHSCNPNCYVAKWSIGEHVRMGIFANRAIKKDEELTFNYNVDRYGHEAQTCYCGEAKCVGSIGGKTQTDLAGMDDLYLDALGITDEVEKLGLKGNKRKKSKKLDEDFMPILKPLVEKDVPKVIQAIRQTSNRKVLFKLLTRLKLTDDMPALRQLMRLRGFSLMTNILDDYTKDAEIPLLAMECMCTWPLLARNKVEDSKINLPVQRYAESAEDEKMKAVAQKLLDQWGALEYAYRIPKRLQADGEEESPSPIVPIADPEPELNHPSKRPKFEEPANFIRPLGYSGGFASLRSYTNGPLSSSFNVETPPLHKQPSKQEVAAIIAAAAKAAAEATPPAATPAVEEPKGLTPEEKAAKEEARRERKKRKEKAKEDRETNKEKKLKKLVGAIVVKCMSKYQKHFDHDTFKKYAKELTETISEKEKKSSSYKEGKLDSFSDEKASKIKKFAKEYIIKVLKKLKDKKRKRNGNGDAAGPSTSTSAPGMGWDAADEPEGEELGGEALQNMMADTMDMDMDDDADDDENMDIDDEQEQADPSASRLEDSPEETEMVVTPIQQQPGDEMGGVGMEVKDPRLRVRDAWDIEPQIVGGM